MRAVQLLLVAAVCWSVAHGATVSNHQTAVNQMFGSMSGASWTFKSGWTSSGGDACGNKWSGVVCDGSSITQINLGFNNVGGSLPTHIGLLNTVTFFSVEGNSVGGTLPTHIGNMAALQTLHLMNNNIGGQLPTHLGNLGNLKRLIIFSNNFGGTLPIQLGNLGNLERFEFQDNNIGGTVPSQISGMLKLEVFRGNDNNVVSPLPGPSVFETLHQNGRLRFFEMARNQLTSPVPNRFAQKPPVAGSNVPINAPQVDLSGNAFDCTMPDSYVVVAHALDISSNGRFICTLSGGSGAGFFGLSDTVTADACVVVDFTTMSSSEGFHDAQPVITLTGTGLNLCTSPERREVRFGSASAQILSTAPDGTSMSIRVPLGTAALDGPQVGAVNVAMYETVGNVKMTSRALVYTFKKQCDAPCDVANPNIAGCNELLGTCVCVAPYVTGTRTVPSDPYCNIIFIPCTPSNCNGHGTCDTTTGICDCDPDYAGIGCSILSRECPAASSGPFAGDNCAQAAGHGTCDITSGNCNCNPPWLQPDCSTRPCPNGCSGPSRGACDSTTGSCNCLPGWGGVDCSVVDLDCGKDQWGRVCANNGVCDRTTGKCVCTPPFQQATNCTTQPCPANCQGQGVCNTTSGVCACNPTYTGPDCSVRDLDCQTVNAEICSGHGTCDRTSGNCQCTSPWILPACGTRPCPGNCNANKAQGTCQSSTGVCSCVSGWGGDDCSVANLTCIRAAANNVECYGDPRGSCNRLTGLCTCSPPWLPETACGEQSCSHLNDCTGHGTCNRQTGTCACDSAWTGAACSLPNLNCYAKNNCTDYEGHGFCDPVSGNCVCAAGWLQPDCLYRRCPLDCSAQGTCDQLTGICTCDDDWTGDACDVPDLDCPGRIYDPGSGLFLDCSGAGTCNRLTGVCLCNQGFFLDDCTGLQCPQDCNANIGRGTCNSTTGICECAPQVIGDACQTDDIDCPGNCHGHGSCNRLFGLCICQAGYDPDTDCQDRLCSVNCGAHGTCNGVTGFCDCDPGYQGTFCDITVNNCDEARRNDCGGHGDCDLFRGSCICEPGWAKVMKPSLSNLTAQCVVCDAARGFVDSPYNPGTCIFPIECSAECAALEQQEQAKCNVSTGICVCAEGRRGQYCDQFVCGPSATTPCSLHGDCVGLDVCECDKGYSGEFCEKEASQSAELAQGMIIGASIGAAALLGGLYYARRRAIANYKKKNNSVEMS